MVSKAMKVLLAVVVVSLALVGCGSSHKASTSTKFTFGQTAKVSESMEITVRSVRAVPASRLARFGVKKSARPYFVRVAVTNIGKTNLGGRPVPLYLQDAHNALVTYSRVNGRFAECPSRPIPKKFPRGSTLNTCLIYMLGRGDTAVLVSYRPDQTKEPITWSGTIAGQKPVSTR